MRACPGGDVATGRTAAVLLLSAAIQAADDSVVTLRVALDTATDSSEAAKTLRAVAERDPPDVLAASLFPIHWQTLDRISIRHPDAVRVLLKKAYPQEPKTSAAPPPTSLIESVVADDNYEKRFDAAQELHERYGERAVLGLLPYLGFGSDESVNAHATLMSTIKKDATLPLCAAMMDSAPHVQDFIVAELAQIGDIRAVPILLEAVESERYRRGSPSRCASAVAKLLKMHGLDPELTAEDAYEEMARRYYMGDSTVCIMPRGQPTLLWAVSEKTGDVVAEEVPRYVYWSELGMRAAKSALRLNPDNENASRLVERFEQSEKCAERLVRECGK